MRGRPQRSPVFLFRDRVTLSGSQDLSLCPPAEGRDVHGSLAKQLAQRSASCERGACFPDGLNPSLFSRPQDVAQDESKRRQPSDMPLPRDRGGCLGGRVGVGLLKRRVSSWGVLLLNHLQVKLRLALVADPQKLLSPAEATAGRHGFPLTLPWSVFDQLCWIFPTKPPLVSLVGHYEFEPWSASSLWSWITLPCLVGFSL